MCQIQTNPYEMSNFDMHKQKHNIRTYLPRSNRPGRLTTACESYNGNAGLKSYQTKTSRQGNCNLWDLVEDRNLDSQR